MNKTERLLEMLEHPERYDEAQWQKILADDECRELYTMMAKTKGAFAAENADAEAIDEMIESEWQRLAQAERPQATIVPLWRWSVAAAACLALVLGATMLFNNNISIMPSADNGDCIVYVAGQKASEDEAFAIAEADVAKMEQFMRTVEQQNAAEEEKVNQFMQHKSLQK